jgi:hypothetical protein
MFSTRWSQPLSSVPGSQQVLTRVPETIMVGRDLYTPTHLAAELMLR